MQRQTGYPCIFRKGLDPRFPGAFSLILWQLGRRSRGCSLVFKWVSFPKTLKLVNDTFCSFLFLSLSPLAYAYLSD
jgi:hypothetical protein